MDQPVHRERLTPQTIRLVDLVDYQDEAIVSRPLIKQKTGNVTLFAFAEGQELSEHTAPYDALVYLLDGKMELTVSGEPFVLQAGDMVIMPANQPHALRAPQPCKMLLVMIRA